MPLGLTMHGKWDGMSMASPTLHSYKHERPAYSTPHPVENTPANNECRMVDLRGTKVASFFVGGDEFICLPQAFDLFLKHLVGGLHTVYTKLKRLNITPVVCNVEQVRILRGLGAIQPGVNRCKLITRKDFEILYQDCTQASRPGRPPKRYPMLPPTTDLMAHHAGIRSMSAAHGLFGATDFSSLQKRMRLDQDLEKHFHQRHERRMSDSPTEDTPSLARKDPSMSMSNGSRANAAEMYLQAQQALRRQYQQVAASSMHNGLESPHAGINPALAPLMMMSHAGLFPGGMPSSMSMLNHINHFAQNFGSGNAVSTAAAAAAAQLAVKEGGMHQQVAAAQVAYQAAVAAQSAAQAAAGAAHNPTTRDANRRCSSPVLGEKNSDSERVDPPSYSDIPVKSGLTNGIGSDGSVSPHSSISSATAGENVIGGRLSVHSDSADSDKDIADSNANSRPQSPVLAHNDDKPKGGQTNVQDRESLKAAHAVVGDGVDADISRFMTSNDEQPFPEDVNISSMQNLLTNIQGLLKVAADNASLQEKQCSFEIADLKAKVFKEKQIRGSVEKKFQESERVRSLIQKKLKEERKARKVLQEQILTIRRQLELEDESRANMSPEMAGGKGDVAPAAQSAGQENAGSISPATSYTFAVSSMQQYSPKSSSARYSVVSSPVPSGDVSTPDGQAHSMVTPSASSSPSALSPQNSCSSRSAAESNSNNSSNNSSASPHSRIRCDAMPPIRLTTGYQTNSDHEVSPELALTRSDQNERFSNADTRFYFRAAHFQHATPSL